MLNLALSLLTIPAALRDGSWPLLKKDLTTPLHNEPGMPLSLLQKQWMKALLQDPRIRLFNDCAHIHPRKDGPVIQQKPDA